MILVKSLLKCIIVLSKLLIEPLLNCIMVLPKLLLHSLSILRHTLFYASCRLSRKKAWAHEVEESWLAWLWRVPNLEGFHAWPLHIQVLKQVAESSEACWSNNVD